MQDPNRPSYIPPPEQRNQCKISQRLPRELKVDIGSLGKVGKVNNLTSLDKQLTGSPLITTITLCPLYVPSAMEESTLLNSSAFPEGANLIQVSRVAKKWNIALRALSTIKDTGEKLNRPVHVIFTFADIGVISKDAKVDNTLRLDQHYHAYQVAARNVLQESDITFSFQRYSDFHARVSDTIIPARRSTRQIEETIPALVQRLQERGVRFNSQAVIKAHDGTLVIDSRTSEVIRKLLKQMGNNFELTEGLLYQYGIFDALTSRPDGLNLFIERESAGLLLQATDLFEHSAYPRIDLLC